MPVVSQESERKCAQGVVGRAGKHEFGERGRRGRVKEGSGDLTQGGGARDGFIFLRAYH